MAPAELMCKDCRDAKVRCIGEYDWDKGEKCTRCKRSRTTKKCSPRSLPLESEPNALSTPKTLAPLAPKAQLPHGLLLTSPPDPCLVPPKSRHATSAHATSNAIRHDALHSTVGGQFQSARFPAKTGRNALDPEELSRTLETIQGDRECQALLSLRRRALTQSEPVQPLRSFSSVLRTVRDFAEILRQANDTIQTHWENKSSEIKRVEMDHGYILQYTANITGPLTPFLPNSKIDPSGIPRYANSQARKNRASDLWGLIRRYDNMLPCAGDQLCVELAQLGPILENRIRKDRLLRAFDRMAQRINITWNESCNSLAWLGPLCTDTQLLVIYNAEWLLEIQGGGLDPDAVIDNILGRSKFLVACESSELTSSNTFFDEHQRGLQERDALRMTPLHVVSSSTGDPRAIEALLRMGATHNALDIFGRTPLCIAAGAGRNEAVELLASKDDPRRQYAPTEQDPVHAAAAGGWLSTLSLLFSRGYNLCLEQDGKRPSQVARDRNHAKAVEFLSFWENADVLGPARTSAFA